MNESSIACWWSAGLTLLHRVPVIPSRVKNTAILRQSDMLMVICYLGATGGGDKGKESSGGGAGQTQSIGGQQQVWMSLSFRMTHSADKFCVRRHKTLLV